MLYLCIQWKVAVEDQKTWSKHRDLFTGMLQNLRHFDLYVQKGAIDCQTQQSFISETLWLPGRSRRLPTWSTATFGEKLAIRRSGRIEIDKMTPVGVGLAVSVVLIVLGSTG